MGKGTLPPGRRQVQPLAQDPKAEPWGDLLAVPFHQSPPPLPSWGNHTPCPAGAPGRHGLAYQGDELPRAVIRSRQGQGVFGECLMLACFMEGNGPRGESEQTQGWKTLPTLGVLRGPGCCPWQRQGEIKTLDSQGSSGYLAQVIRWADCGSGWLHRGPVGKGQACPCPGRVGHLPSGLSDIPQGFGSSSLFLNCDFVIIITTRSPSGLLFRAPAAGNYTAATDFQETSRGNSFQSRSGSRRRAHASLHGLALGSAWLAWRKEGPGAG